MKVVKFKKLMKKILPLFLLISFISFSQEKVKIGIWENFDSTKIPKENLLINSKEKQDGIDNDKNGYVDDILGIGFDEFENTIPANFIATPTNKDFYNHGTMVANILLSKNANVSLCGVGFEYTSVRLKKSGLTKLSTENRLAQLPKEFEKMESFVNKSVDYFAKRNVKIVNLSWGLDLERIAELNPNLGTNYTERKENARLWITTFQKYLTAAFQKYPKILFVVAAGNEGVDSIKAVDVPGIIDLPNVVVVGALNKIGDKPAYFSNLGSNITVFARGEGIKVKDIDGKEVQEDGTSLSAPFVSAYAAKLFQEKLTLVQQIKEKLKTIKQLLF